MLEPIALKGARWVLRRGGGGNASSLSDHIIFLLFLFNFSAIRAIGADSEIRERLRRLSRVSEFRAVSGQSEKWGHTPHETR